MKQGIWFLGFAAFAWAAMAGFPPEPATTDLAVAEAQFMYRGKMINPHIIALFEGWESDSGVPVVTTVDLGAPFDTNQFSDNDVTYDKSGASYSPQEQEGGEDKSSGRYRWIGRTAGGLHVVEFTSHGGGTMVSTTLFFFRFSQGKGWKPSPAAYDTAQPSRLLDSGGVSEVTYPRLLMSVERYYIIGDRVTTNYAIHGNDVVVTFTNQTGRVVKIIHTAP